MQTKLNVNDTLFGFKVVKIAPIEELQAFGIHLVHERTGLEIFHFYNNDSNNLFAFSFPTYPENDCGLPHINEHCVLSGSEKYPLKDSFATFSKGSVNTYMNAFTCSDKTVFPASSVVEEDYFNLFSLYADSVFHPLMSREIFEQEGIRIEADEEGKPIAKGIVFNEMLGDYSDRESLIFNAAFKYLLKETPYEYDSGGAPEAILSLTYEEFLDFYHQHYSPNRCRLFLYGNIETERQLQFLAEELMDSLPTFVGKKESFNTQSLFVKEGFEPELHQIYFPINEEGDDRGEAEVVWAIDERENSLLRFSLLILDHLLLGNNEALLSKRLLEAGMGEDISGLSGLLSELAYPLFFCGMTGVDPRKMKEFKPTVFRALKEICEEGIDSETIEGVLRRLEFSVRTTEIDVNLGKSILERVLRGWLYWDDPFEFIQIHQVIKELRFQLQKNPHYFEKIIQKYLLNNSHQIEIQALADKNEGARLSKRLTEKTEARFQREKDKDPTFPQSSMERFARHQDKKDSPEWLAKVPRLHLDHLQLPFESNVMQKKGPVYLYSQFTNGLNFFAINFNLENFTKEEFMLLPLFLTMSLTSNTDEWTTEEVMKQKRLLTGGIGLSTYCGNDYELPDRSRPILGCQIRYRGIDERFDEGTQFLFDLILKADFHNYRKLKEVLASGYNSLKSDLMGDPYEFASNRIAAAYSFPKRVKYWTEGLPQYELMKKWKGMPKAGLELLARQLDALRDRLFSCKRLTFCGIGEEKFFPEYVAAGEKFYHYCSERKPSFPDGANLAEQTELFSVLDKLNWFQNEPGTKQFELFQVPTGNSYNFLAIPLPEIGNPINRALNLLSEVMTSNYLWNEIRMRGGAYGTSATVNENSGYFLFATYRDPNIKESYDSFKECVRYYAENRLSDTDLEQAKIPVLGSALKPISPSRKGYKAFAQQNSHLTDERRLARREAFLKITSDNLQNAAKWLLANFDNHCCITFSGNQTVKDKLTIKEIAELKSKGEFYSLHL